jgi:hypothetical protein
VFNGAKTLTQFISCAYFSILEGANDEEYFNILGVRQRTKMEKEDDPSLYPQRNGRYF